jgi:hypothetical protein
MKNQVGIKNMAISTCFTEAILMEWKCIHENSWNPMM